jgi:phage terminase large subunit
MRNNGLNATGANKNIKEGIDMVKSNRIYVDINSKNIWREYKIYSWFVNKEGKITDVVLDKDNHSMDAIRYAIYSFRKDYNPFDIDFIQSY